MKEIERFFSYFPCCKECLVSSMCIRIVSFHMCTGVTISVKTVPVNSEKISVVQPRNPCDVFRRTNKELNKRIWNEI